MEYTVADVTTAKMEWAVLDMISKDLGAGGKRLPTVGYQLTSQVRLWRYMDFYFSEHVSVSYNVLTLCWAKMCIHNTRTRTCTCTMDLAHHSYVSGTHACTWEQWPNFDHLVICVYLVHNVYMYPEFMCIHVLPTRMIVSQKQLNVVTAVVILSNCVVVWL